MEIVCLILGWSLIGIGLLGCFVNKIPGPLMAFLGLLLQVWGCDIEMEWWVLALLAVLVVASMVVSKKLVPKVGNLVAEFGKAGAWGTTVGSLVGLMFFAIVCEDASVGIIIFSIIFVRATVPSKASQTPDIIRQIIAAPKLPRDEKTMPPTAETRLMYVKMTV